MSRQQTARAVIYDDQDRLLMIERFQDGTHYFVLPGGHVDPGELPEQAVVREVREETGLEVTGPRLLYTSVDALDQDQRVFLCTYHGGDPVLGAQSIEATLSGSDASRRWIPGWFVPDELLDEVVYPHDLLQLLPADKAINWRHNPYQIHAPSV